MLEMYRKMLFMLESKGKRNFIFLMFFMVLVALAEVLSITVFFLMLEVLSNPFVLDEYVILSFILSYVGVTSEWGYRLAVCITSTFFIMFGLALKTLGSYLMIKFSTNQGYMISKRLFRSYLNKPYEWYLTKNSSEISKNVLSEVNRVVSAVLIPGMRILAGAILSICIVLFLIIADPIIASFCALTIGGGYFFIYIKVKGKLRKLGGDITYNTKMTYKVVQEGTGGFKEVKLYGLERLYDDKYKKPAMHIANSNALVEIYRELPRYLLEGITFTSLLCVVLYLLVNNSGDIAAIIPTLGMFAFSTLKLLPAVQQIYHSLAAMKSGETVLSNIYDDYLDAFLNESKISKVNNCDTDVVHFNNVIEVKKISFSYLGSKRNVLNSVSFCVKKNSSIGIVGGSGAGKSTLVDLLMGLLKPKEGCIEVDGKAIDEKSLPSWKRKIGYVPQTIYLVDDTIAANIAFGVSEDKIDFEKLVEVAKIAAIYDFIENDLPNGFNTQVGERGVRLSGGQKQRIGIARALYKEPSILILDEATSALDNITEKEIVQAIDNLHGNKTLIIIAHRLTTVKKCETILYMEKGSVVAHDKFSDLMDSNENFREMASYNLL